MNANKLLYDKYAIVSLVASPHGGSPMMGSSPWAYKFADYIRSFHNLITFRGTNEELEVFHTDLYTLGLKVTRVKRLAPSEPLPERLYTTDSILSTLITPKSYVPYLYHEGYDVYELTTTGVFDLR